MPNYGEKKYWEERYESQKGKTFDWLEDYNSLNPIIKSLGIKKDAFILNVGCGNSEFSEKMFNDGFINNYNIDICENVINYMKERNKDKKGLHYQAMDVRDMKDFQDETFDLIIDKSTLDALLCGEKSFVNVVLMTKEISRILKTGGIYFIISYGRPEYRLFHLQRKHLAFDIKVIEIKDKNGNDDTVHFGYICTKLPEAKNNINKLNIVFKEMGMDMINNDDNDNSKNNTFNITTNKKNSNKNINIIINNKTSSDTKNKKGEKGKSISMNSKNKKKK